MQAVRAAAFVDSVRPAALPALWLVTPAVGLTPAERQAVEIGRDDAFRYGWDGRSRASWRHRLFARLTGLRPVAPLADPRLEALRLFAAMMRRDDRRVHAAGEVLLAHGLARDALHEAIAIALG